MSVKHVNFYVQREKSVTFFNFQISQAWWSKIFFISFALL